MDNIEFKRISEAIKDIDNNTDEIIQGADFDVLENNFNAMTDNLMRIDDTIQNEHELTAVLRDIDCQESIAALKKLSKVLTQAAGILHKEVMGPVCNKLGDQFAFDN